MNEKITKSLSKGAADSLDFESESDKVRDALDFSFEEALLKMKANRCVSTYPSSLQQYTRVVCLPARRADITDNSAVGYIKHVFLAYNI